MTNIFRQVHGAAGKVCPENANVVESLIMNEYKKLVGDWDYFVIRLRVGIKVLRHY